MKRILIIICGIMLLMAGCEHGLLSQGTPHSNGLTVWKLMYNQDTYPIAKDSSEIRNTIKSKQSIKPQDFQTEAINEITGDTIFDSLTILKSYQVEDGLVVAAVSPKQKVSLRKLNIKGKLLWVKDIDKSGYALTEITILDNGNVVFGVSDWPNTSLGSPSNHDGTLYCFNSKGEQQWTYTYKDTIGCQIKYIFQDKTGNLLCAGLINRGDSSNVTSDVVITQISLDGTYIGEAYFGGSDNEYCEGAAYDKNIGLVFAGWSLSHDGEFAINSTTRYEDYVACVDETLQLKWTYKPQESIRYRHEQIHISEGLISLSGMMMSSPNLNATLYAHVLNGEGKLVQDTMVDQARFPEGSMCITEDQNMIFVYNVENGSKILMINSQGEIVKELNTDLTHVQQVIPLKGGGFIIKYTYPVGYIPQPVYANSRLMDIATTLSCYDRNCQLLWQKTYDDYQGHVQTDYLYISQQ